MMVASALFVWEPWPFTSFRLFSHVRTDQQARWEAEAVGADGRAQAYPLGALPKGVRGFAFTMSEFNAATDARRLEICNAWIQAAPELIGVDAVEVRLYLHEWLLSERSNDRAQPGTRTLEYTCTPSEVVASSDQ